MKRQIFLLFGFFCFWQISQYLLSVNTPIQQEIIDESHKMIAGINIFLQNHTNITRIIIIITSLMIDINVLFVCGNSLWKRKYQPLYIIIAGLTLRQICQFFNRLPVPENMIWFHPQIPSLLVTYSVSNDFFFSGHTFIAMLVGSEIIKKPRLLAKIYGFMFIIIEITFVIVTNGHYFMDVYAAIATYFMLKYFANILKNKSSQNHNRNIKIE